MTSPSRKFLKLLSIDTASVTADVAVTEGDTLLSEITVARMETHSRHLMDMIDTALAMAGVSLQEMDGFSYTRGPGSFTGLRIGLSVIKGLAFSLGKPLVGVSCLDVLACQSMASDRLICAMMDARNKEVYCARYRYLEGKLLPVVPEAVLSPEEAVEGITEPCLLTGEGAERYRLLYEDLLGEKVRFSHPLAGIPRAVTVARLGLDRFAENKIEDIQSVSPVYLRKAFAESRFIDSTP
jgi:tRNA threonylcarbamoyladenosine biosynthesis protein TsaB